MKTIFITIYGGDIEKNILRSSVLTCLKEKDIKIILLVKKGFSDSCQDFIDENIIIEPITNAACFSEKLYYWISWNVIPTRSIYMRRYESFMKHGGWLRYKIGQFLGLLGRFRPWRNFLRFIYYYIPDNYANALFDKYKPDLLFAPSMFSYEDGRLLRQAKKRKIRTITTSKSWDVLTNKAFTRVLADKILVQNQIVKDIAVKIGDYSPEQVEVVGFVQFDFSANPEIILSREEFFKKIGGDPKKKLILYSTSGDWKNPYDDEVVLGIHKAIENGQIKEPSQILARFHPKYPSKIEKLELPFLIKDRPCSSGSKEEDSLDGVTSRVFTYSFKNKDLVHLANTLYHSDVTINTMSTITLDAISFDKPVILIGHDGFDRQLDYWYSIRRVYDEDHYQSIMNTRCARISGSMKETIKFINDYLANPGLNKEGRENVRKKVLYKLDGMAGKRIANAVLKLLD